MGMSYIVQILCGVAALFGVGIAFTKVESEVVRVASIFVLVGIPAAVIYLAGVERRILAKLDALDRKGGGGSASSGS
jgi:hypothetical protein